MLEALCLHEAFHRLDLPPKRRHSLVVLQPCRQRLVRPQLHTHPLAHALHGLPQCRDCLVVISVLVDLDLCAVFIEECQFVEGPSLQVEGDDVFHQVGVRLPAEALEEIRSEDVDVGLSSRACKEDDLLGVPRLQQCLHSSHLVACLRVLLAGQGKQTLSFAHTRQAHQQRSSPLCIHLSLLWSKSFDGLVFQLNVKLHTPRAVCNLPKVLVAPHPTPQPLLCRCFQQHEGLVVSLGHGKKLYCLLLLAAGPEELGTASEDLRVGVGFQVFAHLLEGLEEVVPEADLDSLVELPAAVV
mmetsp:Transcript_34653/g.68450  ORF Transcript_34653/g.68450 Transcript_34653/m.68450 type:complete len:298 (-) Transcript_34653:1128-2021(-)